MVMANLHGFRALTAMGVSIRRRTAAICGRPGMITVVIGVSLVTEQVRGMKIVLPLGGVRRRMNKVSWHSHCVTE